MILQGEDISKPFFPIASNPGLKPPTWVRCLPFDMWFRIWMLVPPRIRIPLFFDLSTRSAFFAALFADMHSLWTDWFVRSRPVLEQSPEFNCAKRLWLWNRTRTGHALPIRIHAEEETYWLLNIVEAIPTSCLPFVEHITINIPRALFTDPALLSTFLSCFPSIRSLDMRANNYFWSAWTNHPLWLRASPLSSECIPQGIRLTNLKLSGSTLSRYASNGINLIALTSLTITNLVTTDDLEGTCLADIVCVAPNIRHLSIESNETQYVDSTFWDPPPQGFRACIPDLQSINVSGNLLDLYRFIETITSDEFIQLRTISSTFFCPPHYLAYMKFDTIPAFRSELTWHADTVDFKESPYTIGTRRSSHADMPMEWVMRWVLVPDGPGPRWVRTFFSLVCVAVPEIVLRRRTSVLWSFRHFILVYSTPWQLLDPVCAQRRTSRATRSWIASVYGRCPRLSR